MHVYIQSLLYIYHNHLPSTRTGLTGFVRVRLKQKQQRPKDLSDACSDEFSLQHQDGCSLSAGHHLYQNHSFPTTLLDPNMNF